MISIFSHFVHDKTEGKKIGSLSKLKQFVHDKVVRRSINNHSNGDDTTLMAESEEVLKSLFIRVKEERESWLKTQHSNKTLVLLKTKIMASSPITSWQIDGENSGSSHRFYFGGSKITPDGDCSHKIKRCLLLGRKAMTNLDSIFKSRDITLPTNVHVVKATVF